jgi:hypothetical protein
MSCQIVAMAAPFNAFTGVDEPLSNEQFLFAAFLLAILRFAQDDSELSIPMTAQSLAERRQGSKAPRAENFSTAG